MASECERHWATVTKIDDPDKRGRIKVKCPGLTGDPDTELPHWVEPTFDWGWFYVPDIEEVVEIEIKAHSSIDESYGQASIAFPDLRWRGKRTYAPQAAKPFPVPSDFTAAYGKQRGFATPFGHVLLFDDSEGAQKVYLSVANSKVEAGQQAQPSACTVILIDKDGSVKVTTLEKDFLHLKPATHELEVSLEGAKHVLSLKPNACEVTLDGGASLKLAGKDASATATIGDGAVKAAIADALKLWYDTQVKLFLSTHIHSHPMGPTGPPTAPPVPPWDPTIESTKVKIPNG